MQVQRTQFSNNNNFGSKIMLTPGAEHLVEEVPGYAWQELKGQLKRLSENGTDDIILLDRRLKSLDLSMKVFKKTTDGLKANDRNYNVNFYAIDWPFGYAVIDTYNVAKRWLENFQLKYQPSLSKLADYHIDNLVQGKKSRIIITDAAMKKFYNMKSKHPDIENTFLKEFKKIEKNGNDDTLLIDVDGKPHEENLVLYLYKKINGVIKHNYTPRFIKSGHLNDSYSDINSNMGMISNEFISKRLSSIYSVV